jgi:hypothetical protein
MTGSPGYENMLATVAGQMGNVVDIPAAVRITDALIMASGGNFHYVEEVKGVLTIQHVITERFHDDDLWNCQFLALAKVAASGGAFRTGKHRLWLDRGALMWEEVDA